LGLIIIDTRGKIEMAAGKPQRSRKNLSSGTLSACVRRSAEIGVITKSSDPEFPENFMALKLKASPGFLSVLDPDLYAIGPRRVNAFAKSYDAHPPASTLRCLSIDLQRPPRKESSSTLMQCPETAGVRSI
jgi:hypothetical protein